MPTLPPSTGGGHCGLLDGGQQGLRRRAEPGRYKSGRCAVRLSSNHDILDEELWVLARVIGDDPELPHQPRPDLWKVSAESRASLAYEMLVNIVDRDSFWPGRVWVSDGHARENATFLTRRHLPDVVR